MLFRPATWLGLASVGDRAANFHFRHRVGSRKNRPRAERRRSFWPFFLGVQEKGRKNIKIKELLRKNAQCKGETHHPHLPICLSFPPGPLSGGRRGRSVVVWGIVSVASRRKFIAGIVARSSRRHGGWGGAFPRESVFYGRDAHTQACVYSVAAPRCYCSVSRFRSGGF